MGFVRNRRRVGGRTLAAALLGTTFLVGLAGPALADDHLEAENAALRSMMEELQQELQILKNMVLEQNQKNMEQDESIAAATEPSAPAKMVKSGKDNVSLKVYGQVNRMMLRAGAGDESRTFHADNDISSTRIGLKGKAKMDDGWSAGATVEVQIESNSSAKVKIDQTKDHGDLSKPGKSHDHDATITQEDVDGLQAAGDSVTKTSTEAGGETSEVVSFTERKLEVWIQNKGFGKLSLGQGSTASDGTIEEDLSGTGVITGSGFSATGDSISFMRRDVDGRESAGVSVGDIFGNHDGLSRKDRIRYDSPTFGGVQLSGSWLGDQWNDDDETVVSGAWDVALRYGREFDGYEVAAAVSRWEPNDDETGQGGSASILAPFGTSLSASYSVVSHDADDHDAKFTYFKLGQDFKALDIGRTSVSVGTADADSPEGKGTGGDYYDLALVQRIKGLGAELYAVYGVYDASIRGVPTDEIDILGAGARIKF